jgi:PmbA protein
MESNMSRNGKTDEASAVAQEQVWARETAERLVEAARRAGASQCDATVGLGSSLQAKARDGEIEDISRSRSRAAGIRVIVDGRLGFATAAEAPRSNEAIDELARTAVALAEVSTASEHNLIPEPTAASVATNEAPEDDLALWDPAIANAEPQWAAENALAMESVIRNAAGIQSVREAGASTSWGVFALATSTGFLGSYASTSAYLGASGVADEGDGKKQVDGWWDASRELSTLQEPESIAKKAIERVLARVGAKKKSRAPRRPSFLTQVWRRVFLLPFCRPSTGMLSRDEHHFSPTSSGRAF